MTRSEVIEIYTTSLSPYLPGDAVETICNWIIDYNFDFEITRKRRSKLGDYRPPFNGERHKITVNHNLDPFSFLVTLVHEVAHLTTHNKFGHRVKPHGSEWKNEFRILMQPFLQKEIFPPEITHAINRYLVNPAAASCSDPHLLRTLKNHHPQKNGIVFLEQLPEHALFRTEGNRYFIKGPRIKKRYRCKSYPEGHTYLISPVQEVLPVDSK